MLINIQNIIGCSVRTVDSGKGKIRGIYFDARQWQVKYFSVAVGGWFSRREVLLPPESFSFRGNATKSADVPLTRAEINRSPTVKRDLAISQAAQNGAVEFPRLPGYRDMTRKNGRITVVDTTVGTEVAIREIPGARYLLDAGKMRGYRLEAVEGEAGRCRYFMADSEAWVLRYAALAPGRALRPRKAYALLPVHLIDVIDAAGRRMRTTASMKALVSSPPYSPGTAVEPSTEKSLDSYYSLNVPSRARWRFDRQIRTVPAGQALRIEVLAPAVVRWSTDNWQTVLETKTHDTGRGLSIADLDTGGLAPGAAVCFTFFWLPVKRWEGKDFTAVVGTEVPEPILETAGV